MFACLRFIGAFLTKFVIMKPATIREILSNMSSSLGQAYGDDSEGKAVAELLLADLLQTTRAGLYSIGEGISDPQLLGQIQHGFDRLMNHEPIQYILGKSWFNGLELHVAPGVLIPRPETEELVEWVVKNHQHESDHVHFVDIGTGSGCIALALKKEMPQALVTGIDISDEALKVAALNARRHHLDVVWMKRDVFQWHEPISCHRKLVIVSNPPYVLEIEKTGIAPRVLHAEPHLALFVPDTDPLKYYRQVLQIFGQSANSFWFEVNPICVPLFSNILDIDGFGAHWRHDYSGKLRMLAFSRHNVL